uniref:Nuclear speckle splicing regulatory protein 1 n=1 Tax=Otolemur garnettii TaxID=30611 RepID=H0XLD9_OTOGA
MAIPGRQYGLILPKKTQQLHPVLQKPSVFGNDCDDDDEWDKISMSESLQREAAKKQSTKQSKPEMQKALVEDSTVYEYEIYDEMQKKEERNSKLLLEKDRKPKYIPNLLKQWKLEKRNRKKNGKENTERVRMEKGEFDDEEAFVTSAYKKKPARDEEEEREKRVAALEAHWDITKQEDLSGFYRLLLNQAVGEEEVPKCSFREARSGIKVEKSRGYTDEVNSKNIIPQEKCILETGLKVEENPDADSDFDAKSCEDSEMEEKNITETSKNDSKHHGTQSHSRSCSKERGHGAKCRTNNSKSRGHEQRQEWHQENHYTDHDSQKEKDSHRHREARNRDSHWKRHEQEDELRARDQRERSDKEWKRDKDGKKCSSREQERNRQRNAHKRGETEEKSREKEEYMKRRRERYENNDKYRDREKQEVSVQSSEKNRARKESRPNSRAKDKLSQPESSKMRNMEKDKERNQEKPSRCETSPDQNTGSGGKQGERPPEAVSKFAKPNNEETVMSARDRYSARQMACVSTKTYTEKEEV